MKPQNILKIYDNGGKTVDRYTVVLKDWRNRQDGARLFQCLGLSEEPTAWYGFSQCGEAIIGRHLGKIIQWKDLPEKVRTHAKERLLEE